MKDLIAARLASGGDIRFEVEDVTLADLDTDAPQVAFTEAGERQRSTCDFVVGADGFHGISRDHVAGPVGVRARVPVRVARHPRRGAAVLARAHLLPARRTASRCTRCARRRSPGCICRCPPPRASTTGPTSGSGPSCTPGWPTDDGFALTEGPLLDKGITPMRSFVADADAARPPVPGRRRRAHRAADRREGHEPRDRRRPRCWPTRSAATTPTGREDLLDAYTDTALQRVWRATHFSWWMTLDRGSRHLQRLQPETESTLLRVEQTASRSSRRARGVPSIRRPCAW